MDLAAELARAFNEEDSVDHRWFEADKLVSSGEKTSRIDDQLTRRAVSFLRSFKDNRSTRGTLVELKKADRPIYEAFKWYSSIVDRNRVESLLMCADLPINRVAEEMSTSLRAIEAYAGLFFDILDYREDKSRLWRLVANRSPYIRDTGYGSNLVLWPTLAIQYGYRVLRYVMNPVEMTQEEKKIVDAVIEAEIRITALRTAKDAPVSSYTAQSNMITYAGVRDGDFKREQLTSGVPEESAIATIFLPILENLGKSIRVLSPREEVPMELTMGISERLLIDRTKIPEAIPLQGMKNDERDTGDAESGGEGGAGAEGGDR